MTEVVYEKTGRSSRVEWLGETTITHRLEEYGRAVERGGDFRATAGAPYPHGDALPHPPPPDIRALLKASKSETLSLQRIVSVSGCAMHRLTTGSEEREWRTTDALTHVELSLAPLRRMLALESYDAPATLADEISLLGEVLRGSRADGAPPEFISLHPRVTAQLLAMRLAAGALGRAHQIPTTGARDGDGLPIAAGSLESLGSPPNRARPSYRHPPRRAWMYGRVDTGSTGDEDSPLPRAVALLAHRSAREGASVELIVATRAGWDLVELAGDWNAWTDSVGSVRTNSVLYPFAPAPHYGAESTLDTRGLRARVR